MRHKIVRSSTILTLLGGGPKDVTKVKQRLTEKSTIVAADGGADFCVQNGISPAAVIGDMDSISPATINSLDAGLLYQIAEQDSTDFEKCLQRIDAPVIEAFGFTGGRLDHQLAACTVLVRFPEQRCVLVGDEDICFLAPRDFALDLPVGARFSLFPMAEMTGNSEGLKFPINDLSFAPSERVGTSNEVIGPVRVTVSKRMMLVLLPPKFLDTVLDMLRKS